MRTIKASRRTAAPSELEVAEAALEYDGDEVEAYETYEIYRVVCPDCAQPIALLADERVLPEHALCPTPWNPFGLTVCRGSGLAATDTEPVDATKQALEQDAAMLLTLPKSLDWRMQPFSHVGGAQARPVRLPSTRTA